MQEECYHLLFRKKFYNILDELQVDVDTWIISYNNERYHSGKHCFEKIPMQLLEIQFILPKKKILVI